ncbi:MAG TPA: hypothetical protein VGY56_09425 [Verrucomicrobiae bacterium]|nr:hypothetical protein [Verrucomicrobiae bacterium]
MKTHKFVLSVVTAGFIATATFTVHANDYRTRVPECSIQHDTLPLSNANVLEYDQNVQAALPDDAPLVAAEDGRDNTANLLPTIASANAQTRRSQRRFDEEKSSAYPFVPQPGLFTKMTDVKLHWRTVKFFSNHAILSIGDNGSNFRWHDTFDQFPFGGAWAGRNTGVLNSQPDGFRFLSWSF